MTVWITSDTHFGHANIIKYTGRPFKNVQEMDYVLIKNWNKVVKKSDTVYFLGDFCFKGNKLTQDYLNQLNGTIIFIKGNHDNNNLLENKPNSIVIKHENQEIFCTHMPEHANLKYKINFVGHVHQKWKTQKVKNSRLINVGVDVNNFTPQKIETIIKTL